MGWDERRGIDMSLKRIKIAAEKWLTYCRRGSGPYAQFHYPDDAPPGEFSKCSLDMYLRHVGLLEHKVVIVNMVQEHYHTRTDISWGAWGDEDYFIVV